ncbi:MAG: CBS domain-containing protein [Anaerolineales bacterium]|jgi:CBS domain-containing protein|nr:CBS domain-containing protein [Anaerolineales bacterium]
MHHHVRDWMKSPIIVVDPDSSVSHALTLMRRRGIHSLVVGLENGYGIVTSTDIRDKIIAPNRNPADTQVSTIMTAPVITAHPDWTLVQCSQLMQSHNFHHLPVADDHGNLVGMISATDLFVAAEEIGWGKE